MKLVLAVKEAAVAETVEAVEVVEEVEEVASERKRALEVVTGPVAGVVTARVVA